jgi:hypothetical protein
VVCLLSPYAACSDSSVVARDRLAGGASSKHRLSVPRGRQRWRGVPSRCYRPATTRGTDAGAVRVVATWTSTWLTRRPRGLTGGLLDAGVPADDRPVPPVEVPPEPARALLAGPLCRGCGASLAPRQRLACSGRCRALLSRPRQIDATHAEVATLSRRTAELEIENGALRQRVAELERLVGQLKRRLWPTA